MSNRMIFICCLLAFTFSCDDEETGSYPLLLSCTSLLGCGAYGDNVPFCTWGYKFGDSNPYSPSGPNISGPKSKAALISYKFLDDGVVFKTFYQNTAVSMVIDDGYRSEIRKVISEWSSVADISFNEKSGNESTDITIASAFIPLGTGKGGGVGGLGTPAFVSEPCKQIAGLLVLSPKFPSARTILHEMGHVLGLGHVSSQNIMNPSPTVDHLQPGDIAGIQSIYGSK
jgi:hypothetical protein